MFCITVISKQFVPQESVTIFVVSVGNGKAVVESERPMQYAIFWG